MNDCLTQAHLSINPRVLESFTSKIHSLGLHVQLCCSAISRDNHC